MIDVMIYDDPEFLKPAPEKRWPFMSFQNPFQQNLPDPWRCGYCKELIYNVALDPVTQRWVPVPGAPLRAAYHVEYGDICQTCTDILEAIKPNKYMIALHEQYLKDVAAAKEKAKRLGRNLSDGSAGTA